MSLLQNENYAFSTLASGITDSDTAVTLQSGHGARFPSSGYFMAAIWGSAYASPSLDSSRELVRGTFTSGDTFAIDRAYESTSASAWSSGDNFALVFTAGKMDEVEGVIQDNTLSFDVATGTNTYAVALDPALGAYALGQAFNIKFTNASTGASTLSINGLAAKKLYFFDHTTGAYTQVGSGDIIAGMYSTVFYDTALDSSAGGFILSSHLIDLPTEFISGDALLFPQAAAPTGWTLDSSWSTVRSIIIGNSYGTGGTDSATGFTSNISVDAHAPHTHTGPSHTHTGSSHTHAGAIHNHKWLDARSGTDYTFDGSGNDLALSGSASSDNGVVIGSATINKQNVDAYTDNASGTTGAGGTGATGASGTGATGSGGPTTHTVNQHTYAPRYMTVIRATKD